MRCPLSTRCARSSTVIHRQVHKVVGWRLCGTSRTQGRVACTQETGDAAVQFWGQRRSGGGHTPRPCGQLWGRPSLAHSLYTSPHCHCASVEAAGGRVHTPMCPCAQGLRSASRHPWKSPISRIMPARLDRPRPWRGLSVVAVVGREHDDGVLVVVLGLRRGVARRGDLRCGAGNPSSSSPGGAGTDDPGRPAGDRRAEGADGLCEARASGQGTDVAALCREAGWAAVQPAPRECNRARTARTAPRSPRPSLGASTWGPGSLQRARSGRRSMIEEDAPPRRARGRR